MNALALTYADSFFPQNQNQPARRPSENAYASAQTRDIRVSGKQEWKQDAYARLIHLMSLGHGWDGSDSLAVRPEIATFAWCALESVMTPSAPVPFIAPVSGGGLQIEWHTGGLDIELYISQPSRAELFIEYADGRERVENDLSSDFGPLSSAIAEIS